MNHNADFQFPLAVINGGRSGCFKESEVGHKFAEKTDLRRFKYGLPFKFVYCTDSTLQCRKGEPGFIVLSGRFKRVWKGSRNATMFRKLLFLVDLSINVFSMTFQKS